MHSCNACNAAQCSGFEQVQASGGAPGRGGVNPLGFSPALLRGGDDRLGRSLDPILLYYQSYHSRTIVSVTAVTFTARSVHSRAADPDTLHFRLAAARARSMSIRILPAVARPSTATAPTRYSRRCRLALARDVIRPRWRLRCHSVLWFSCGFIVLRCDCRGGGGCSRAECRR